MSKSSKLRETTGKKRRTLRTFPWILPISSLVRTTNSSDLAACFRPPADTPFRLLSVCFPEFPSKLFNPLTSSLPSPVTVHPKTSGLQYLGTACSVWAGTEAPSAGSDKVHVVGSLGRPTTTYRVAIVLEGAEELDETPPTLEEVKRRDVRSGSQGD